MYDLVIVGGGSAGLTAAIYGGRKKIKTLLVTGPNVGGETNSTNDIQNYPGYEGPGPELMKKFLVSAKKWGAELLEQKVTKITKPKNFLLELDNGDKVESKAVIICYGRERRKLNIPGEDKFFGRGLSTCTTCLPPQELVVGNSCVKPIKSMRPKERILTVKGKYGTIKETMKREFNGNLIKITPRFFTEGVLLTPKHRVLKKELIKGKGKNYWDWKFTENEWVQANSLKKGDLVQYPIPNEEIDLKQIKISDFIDIKIDSKENAMNVRETHTSKRLPNKIIVSKDFLRLVGYYLAEGCITKGGVNFYFSKKEHKYIKDVNIVIKSVFKIKPTIKEEGNVSRIMNFSSIMRDVFESLFGKYAHGKKLPHFMMLLPPSKQKEILKGVWRGDGCLREKDFCLVTNSQQLTYQVRDLLLRQGIIPSIQIRKKDKLQSSYIEGREIRFNHDKYHIIVGGPGLNKMSQILGVLHPKLKNRKHSCAHAWIKKGCALLPIRKIEKIRYKGPVYNIATQTNTYVAKNFIVHNCDAPLFPNKETVVIGGGNSGVEGALELSRIAKTIYLVHRRDQFRADEVTVEKAKKDGKIQILTPYVPVEIKGDKFVEVLVVENVKTKEKKELAVQGIFSEIGWITNTDIVEGLVETNKVGEIIVDELCKTKTSGLYACGDLTAIPYKQTVISAGMGATAALEAYKFVTGAEATHEFVK